MQAHSPERRSASFYNVAVSHLLGTAVGFATVRATTRLLALGSFHPARAYGRNLVAGVLLVAGAGELLKQLRRRYRLG